MKKTALAGERPGLSPSVVSLTLAVLAVALPLFAQSDPTYIQFSPAPVKGALYTPDRGPSKLTQCEDTLSGLPLADGLILIDAHPGTSINHLRSLNPAVVDERAPRQLDSALDPFNPANGYQDGASRYSDEFKRKYFKAQADRMNRLIDRALADLKAMQSGSGPYPDDNALVITRAAGARLMELDPRIHDGTLKPQKLLQNDGTVVTQIVKSVRRPRRGQKTRNASFERGARMMTLRSFLSTYAIRAKDSLDEIDWCSSNNSTDCALPNIAIPTLITAMGAHYFIRDSEIHYERSASRDKEFIVIAGATHRISPCTACETTPGQYGNSGKNFFDHVTQWINARF